MMMMTNLAEQFFTDAPDAIAADQGNEFFSWLSEYEYEMHQEDSAYEQYLNYAAVANHTFEADTIRWFMDEKNSCEDGCPARSVGRQWCPNCGGHEWILDPELAPECEQCGWIAINPNRPNYALGLVQKLNAQELHAMRNHTPVDTKNCKTCAKANIKKYPSRTKLREIRRKAKKALERVHIDEGPVDPRYRG